jgi:hypothetical protein
MNIDHLTDDQIKDFISKTTSQIVKIIWNAAIEEAALKIKEQYDHFEDAVIMHYKPMWIDEIRKLKK